MKRRRRKGEREKDGEKEIGNKGDEKKERGERRRRNGRGDE